MSRVSRLVEVAHALRAMSRARDRERSPAERMSAHQAAALDVLIRDAIERSPFHRSRLAGVIRDDGSVDLAALPTLDKATLMASFVDALCARSCAAATCARTCSTPSRCSAITA